MCGINVILRKKGDSRSDHSLIQKMNEEMRYRGPDGSGIWSSDEVTLGMVRLSIIGLATGQQPIFSSDKSLVLVCNGEIYNYVELRDSLIKRGRVFQTDSDVETILHLYEEKGEEAVKDLRGMFAFALWDSKKRKLFVGRDRCGEKPLYIYENSDYFLISSEMKAIERHGMTMDGDIDYEILRQVYQFGYPVDMSKTHITQIRRLLPGLVASLANNEMRTSFYW